MWIKSAGEKKSLEGQAERFTSVYAETVVMAELYRNEPDIFFKKRDSIFHVYGVDSAWVYGFRQELETQEEKWSPLWNKIKIKVDSLVEYYKENPVTHREADTSDIFPHIEEN